jgi:hypothetical protein
MRQHHKAKLDCALVALVVHVARWCARFVMLVVWCLGTPRQVCRIGFECSACWVTAGVDCVTLGHDTQAHSCHPFCSQHVYSIRSIVAVYLAHYCLPASCQVVRSCLRRRMQLYAADMCQRLRVGIHNTHVVPNRRHGTVVHMLQPCLMHCYLKSVLWASEVVDWAELHVRDLWEMTALLRSSLHVGTWPTRLSA